MLDGIFGKAVEDAAGGILDEATGGIFGGAAGGSLWRYLWRRVVARLKSSRAYDPLSQVPSVIASATFNSMLAGVTNPYLDTIPFEPGGNGVARLQHHYTCH